MLTFTLILFLIACGGFIFSIIQIIKNIIKKQDNKKNKKILIGCFVLAIVAMAIPTGSSSDTEPTKTVPTQNKQKNIVLTASDKELLKGHYKDFDDKKRTKFAEIEEKYNKLNKSEKEKIKTDFERISKERKDEEAAKAKAEAEAEAKKKQEFINKNTKTLSAGEHIVGKHLDPGGYIVTFNGSGNFFVHGSDGSALTNEIGGPDIGISKYKAIFPEGAKIKISGMSINVKPLKSSLVEYGNVNLYAGYWIVGQDVTSGRYKVSIDSGSGNFFVYSKDGIPKTNEILGSDMGVSEVIIDLEDGDIIKICSLNNVKLVPEE